MSGLNPAAQLSDAQLRSRLFTIGDPESLPDLVEIVPEADGAPEIEYAYDLTPGKKAPRRDFVYCAHCGHPTHYRGYVVRFHNARCLIGKDCGFRLYGADFHTIERGFMEERRRQLTLLRLDDALSGLPNLLRAVHEIAAAPGTRMFDRARGSIRNRWSALGSLAGASSDLFINEQVRDHAAELERDQRGRSESDEDDPIFTFVSKVIGPLNGAAFCRPDIGSAEQAFQAAEAKFKAEYQRLRQLDTQGKSTRQLRNAVSDLLEEVEGIIAFERPMHAVISFFGPENLSRVAEWANHLARDGSRYEVLGLSRSSDSPVRRSAAASLTASWASSAGLSPPARSARLVRISHGEAAEAFCPPGYTPPDLSPIHAFLTKLKA